MQALYQLLDQQQASEATYPFGEQARVYKVMGKMYALIAENGVPGQSANAISLKAKPEDVSFLIDQFPSIKPGYHLSKKHWVTIELSALELEEFNFGFLQSLVEDSYSLVVGKLTRKQKDQLAALQLDHG